MKRFLLALAVLMLVGCAKEAPGPGTVFTAEAGDPIPVVGMPGCTLQTVKQSFQLPGDDRVRQARTVTAIRCPSSTVTTQGVVGSKSHTTQEVTVSETP